MKRYYINNNSLGSFIGSLKVFDENNNCIAKIKGKLLSNSYKLVTNNNQFLMRTDEADPIHHKYTVSFDENANNLQLEIGQKTNVIIGFGLGHFVLLPFASIPFGSYYGVSKRGDILVSKKGNSYEVNINKSIIARIKIKTGSIASMMSSKSSIDILTNDNTLTMYALAIFLIIIGKYN